MGAPHRAGGRTASVHGAAVDTTAAGASAGHSVALGAAAGYVLLDTTVRTRHAGGGGGAPQRVVVAALGRRPLPHRRGRPRGRSRAGAVGASAAGDAASAYRTGGESARGDLAV
eukprot:ctg_172.g97